MLQTIIMDSRFETNIKQECLLKGVFAKLIFIIAFLAMFFLVSGNRESYSAETSLGIEKMLPVKTKNTSQKVKDKGKGSEDFRLNNYQQLYGPNLTLANLNTKIYVSNQNRSANISKIETEGQTTINENSTAKPKVTHQEKLFRREASYEDSFEKVGAHFHIPSLLLKAIARQESGCQPFVINIQGRDFYPKTKEEALELCTYADKNNLSYDVGVMQINRYWIRKYKLPHTLLLNPIDNIYTGGFILAQHIKRNGLTWRAVGYYHSQIPWRALDYAQKIRKHLLNLLDS